MANHIRDQRRTAVAAGLGLVVCASLWGCRTSPDVAERHGSPHPYELANAEDVRGPLERVLHAVGRGRHEEYWVTPPEATAEFEEAEKLYEDGEYRKAEKIFKRVAKKYKTAPIREDALFMTAECQFARKRYSWAQDSYDRLAKEYPSTRYLDRFSRRQFEIARLWLRFPEVVTSGEIQQVDFENIRATPPPKNDQKMSWDPSRIVPIFPNVADRSRPVFDTDGRALQALRSIWLNDPTGPLADDAIMLTASHYLRKGDYLEADRMYTILREEYPKSPHLENSFVLGSHVKLMSYQGAAYDGTDLDEARQLKESTLRLFPDHPDRQRVEEEVRKIAEAKAARDWEMVAFYQKKNKPRAVAIYCRTVIRKHPQTTYADRARQVLAELDPQVIRDLGMIGPGSGRQDQPTSPRPNSPYEEPPGRASYDEPPGRSRL